MQFTPSPLFAAVSSLLPAASFADMGRGAPSADVLATWRANWPNSAFVTYFVGGSPWTIRFDIPAPSPLFTQAQINTALGQQETT